MSMGRTFRARKRRDVSKKSSETRNCDIEELCQWMSRENWKNTSSLRPFNFAATGRGLQAVRSISIGDVLVSIPRNLVVTCKRALHFPALSKLFKDMTNPLYPTAQQILSAFLLLEKRDQDSLWKTYIQGLPKSFSTPHFVLDLNRLPCYIREKVISEIAALRKSLCWINAQMKRSKLEEFSWSDFLWAWFAVNTRAVYVEPSQDKICKDKDNIALAPFLDLLNHSPHIEPNKVGWNGDFYQIKASKSFKKHDQVYISYGAHDNLTLCLEYGFIVAKNSHDRVIFSKEDILKVLQPDRKVDECDGIIWCTREGLNWTGLVYIAKCLKISASNFAENVIVSEAAEKVIRNKVETLNCEVAKMTGTLEDSLAVIKDLIQEHLDLLSVASEIHCNFRNFNHL